MDAVYQALAEVVSSNQTAALCTVVRSEGSTPRHVGSKMLVYPNGRFIGTVGGGELEHRVLAEAAQAISDGSTRLRSYTLTDLARGDPGAWGGQMDGFVAPILSVPTLVVIGAGPCRAATACHSTLHRSL